MEARSLTCASLASNRLVTMKTNTSVAAAKPAVLMSSTMATACASDSICVARLAAVGGALPWAARSASSTSVLRSSSTRSTSTSVALAVSVALPSCSARRLVVTLKYCALMARMKAEMSALTKSDLPSTTNSTRKPRISVSRVESMGSSVTSTVVLAKAVPSYASRMVHSMVVGPTVVGAGSTVWVRATVREAVRAARSRVYE
mmetsp:Transcript_18618/g.50036  ORF Transcript_18618/g.50036 Transcript_18618/m.50036 type:complete len:203 (+) Transcript_18618:1847-2455(+)